MVLPGPGRRVAAVALVCALVAVAAAPGAGGAAVASGSAAVAQQETPTNETVRHEDPRSVDRRGDLGAVERYLAGRLSERLGGATASISREEYEAGRSLLGDEYDALLARYVDVAGETEGTADDGAAESFREAGNRTRDLAGSAESFDETYEAYRRAEARGETARARTLGRRLLERARDVDRTEDRLAASLRSIEEATGRDTGEARERVRAVATSVRERADAVARETFVRTRLSAAAEPTEASFVEPTTVRGRLVAANGSGLAGATVLVGAEGEAVSAETNGSGAFVATYRPVRLSVDAGAVPVRYVPADASGYLGNRTDASVAVAPVTPEVGVETGSATAAFGDAVAVSGSVTAGGVGVPGVPVVASVGGVPLGRGVTESDGGYALSGSLPADVPAGHREVSLRVDQTGRAVASASGTAPLAVEATPTTVTLSGSIEADGTATVSGRLLTDDGRGVGGRSIRLLAEGEPAGTVTTDDAGRVSARIEPGIYEAGSNGSVTVSARFDGGGTNLDGARASVALAVPDAADAGPVDQPATWRWLAVVVLVGLLVAGWLFTRWRGSPDPDTDARGTEPAAGEAASGGGAATDPVDTRWRDDVTELLDAGETDAAVERAYAAVRARLAAELGATGALTHWEFYAAAREDGLAPDRVEALLALTEAYERARFAPGSTAAGDASAAVERVDEALSG